MRILTRTFTELSSLTGEARVQAIAMKSFLRHWGQKGKPHAETFTVVAQKLGLDPAECVVFEDAILGEQAAYRANMRCVGVSTTLEAKEFQAPLAVIKDFVGFSPEQLRALFAGQAQVPKPSKLLASRQYAQQE